MRDEQIKKAFIAYLEQSTDERFFQALTNFTQLPYIGSASDNVGSDFRDLWSLEADIDIEWVSR
ncbi:hypothetical protein UFOVP253_10 [uncultured Caudovirales phage]|uniref:Uncharacterized protein n=1 Tax=uncultured Caudovirales phage TaxID=2100421 RepID=A0A6J5LEA6_9CAUD|nr:hypothetical protein UFOVP253_10 [uncultured Caudovirales phage]